MRLFTFVLMTALSANAFGQTNRSSSFLEIRPLTQQDFLRWRNEPGIRGLQQGKPLKCFNVDRDMERARASSVYLSVAVLPPQTGLAVLDAIIRLNP